MSEQKVLVQLHEIRESTAGDTLIINSIISGGNNNLQFEDPFTNGGAPVTLNQLFTSGGVVNWTDLGDTQPSISALQFVRGNAAGTGLEFVTVVPGGSYDSLSDTPASKVIDSIPFADGAGTDHVYDPEVRGDQVKTAEPATSGILSQGDGFLTFIDATDLTVDAGTVKLIERVTNLHTREHAATWITQNITVPGGVLSDPFGVVVLEDIGFTGTATPVVVSLATADPDYLSERTRLGYTVHQAGALIAVIQAPEVYKDHGRGLEAIWRAIGISKLSGTGVHVEIASTLTSSVTASVFTGRDINFHNNPDDAHRFVFPAEALMVFDETANDGTVFATGVNDFATSFNSSGVKTALTGQKAVVHQVYHIPGVGDFCQLGTTDYQNFDTAAQSLVLESVNNPLPQTAQLIGIRHSYVVLRAGVSQWAAGDARILPILGGNTAGAPSAIAGIPELPYLELILTTDTVFMSTTPGQVPYDDDDNGLEHIRGFFSYASPELRCIRDCVVTLDVRADYAVNSASSVAGLRLDVRKNGTTVQLFDEESEEGTDKDGQCQGFATVHFVATDTIKVYANSYISGRVDVWGDANRLRMTVIKDLG